MRWPTHTGLVGARLMLTPALMAALVIGLSTGCMPPEGKPGEGESAGQGAPAEGASEGNPAKGAAGEGAPATPAKKPRRVEVITLKAAPLEDEIELSGAVDAIDDVTLSAQAAGTVEQLADLGAEVQEGEPVATLDRETLIASLDMARAQVAQASAQVKAARVGLKLASDLYDRQKPLHDEKIISDQEFQQIESQKLQAEAQVVQARAAVSQAKANGRQIRAQLKYTRVKAPFTGTVEQRMVELGEQVAPGMPVARLVNLSRVKVVAGVPERYAAEIKAGAAARIAFTAYQIPERRGAVSFVGQTINPDNRTFNVEVALDNPDGLLKPEMIARIKLVRAVIVGALVVPEAAVLRDEEGGKVFVIEAEGEATTVKQVRVKTRLVAGGRALILEGLTAGQQVVVKGASSLITGDTVEVVEAGEPAR